jgi:hypothetical protein
MKTEPNLAGLHQQLIIEIGRLEGRLAHAFSLRDQIAGWLAGKPAPPPPTVVQLPPPPDAAPPPVARKAPRRLKAAARRPLARAHCPPGKLSMAERAGQLRKLPEPYTCPQLAAKLGWTKSAASGFAVKAEVLGWLHSVKVNGVREYRRTAKFGKLEDDSLAARSFAAAQARADDAMVSANQEVKP